jgi:flagellar basal-body rod modification protein FlgD
MSIAAYVATQQAKAAAAGTSSSSSTTAGNGSSTALNSLSSNFSNFLGMLMTQLRNQDPSSPMDSNQFTSELVQFTSVEQQINTNTSLTQLIQLTQSGEVMQSSAMIGKEVAVTSTNLSLQNGTAGVSFNAPAAEPVKITIANANGVSVYDTTVSATNGSNNWTWKGQSSSGSQLPDGSYAVTVTGQNADGTATPLTYTVVGTATAVQSTSAGALTLSLGSLSVPFSSVVAVR